MTPVLTLPDHRHIVLIGLMGAGKTSIGRIIAKRLKMSFTDADTEIEKAAGLTIWEIFKVHGEQAFRDGEGASSHASWRGARVLATGGGAFHGPRYPRRHSRRGFGLAAGRRGDALTSGTASGPAAAAQQRGSARQARALLAKLRYPIYAEADIIVEHRAEKPRERRTHYRGTESHGRTGRAARANAYDHNKRIALPPPSYPVVELGPAYFHRRRRMACLTRPPADGRVITIRGSSSSPMPPSPPII
jgi:shikimate kinase